MAFAIRLGLGAVLALSLAACNEEQRPVVSLEQAKQITAQFQISEYAPPQRTLDDLRVRFGEPLPIPRGCPASAETAKRDQETRLGTWRPGARATSRALRNEAEEELRLDNLVLALGFAERAVQATDLRGEKATALVMLARVRAVLGNLRSADAAMGEAGVLATSIPAQFQANWRMQEAQTRAAIAEARGDLREAESVLVSALRQARGITEAFNEVPRAKDQLAKVLALQGRFLEAEVAIRDALAQREMQGFSTDNAIVAASIGEVLLQQSRFDEALAFADIAINRLEANCVAMASLKLNSAYALKGRVLVARGDFVEGLKSFAPIERNLAGDATQFNRRFAGDPDWLVALAMGGDARQALTRTERALALAEQERGRNSREATEYVGIAALASAAAGDRAAARTRFDDFADRLNAQPPRVSNESGTDLAARRLATLVDAALAVYIAAGDEDSASRAFALAERARGGSVQRVVVESGARAVASTPELADLLRREQDTNWQIEAVSAQLVNAAGAGGSTAQQATQLRQLRQAQAALRTEIGSRFGSYAQLLDPKPPTLATLRGQLRPGEAMVATYTARERTFIWAVTATGPVAFASASLTDSQARTMVRDLRKALDPQAASLGDIPAYDTKTAHDLYTLLLKPVERGWAGASNLLIVAQGALGQIPFEVLVTEPYTVPAVRTGEALFSNYRGVPWLARKAAITWLPSVTALTSLRNIPAPAANRLAFAGFGDPWFSPGQATRARQEAAAPPPEPTEIAGRGLALVRRNAPETRGVSSFALAQLPRLPDTADEVRSIGTTLGADPARDIILGERATEQRVKSMDLYNRKVVLFATHGLTAGELDGLTQPALAMTPQSVSGEPGDGLLTLSDVMGLRLNADWVVLSACNTGSADGAGAEAVSGLGRGFFYAGARALLVTHWPVETTSAKTLTVDLFRRQAADGRLNRAQALQAAKLALIDAPGYVDRRSNRVAFSYAHPLFWAPYALVGDPGAGTPGM